MKLPNRERAIVSPDKLIKYLLNPDHKKGGTKAHVLASAGYTTENWRQLENDLRQYHLTADVSESKQTAYGVSYEIRAPLQSPNGRTLIVRSIWQIDKGTTDPRFITLFPD